MARSLQEIDADIKEVQDFITNTNYLITQYQALVNDTRLPEAMRALNETLKNGHQNTLMTYQSRLGVLQQERVNAAQGSNVPQVGSGDDTGGDAGTGTDNGNNDTPALCTCSIDITTCPVHSS